MFTCRHCGESASGLDALAFHVVNHHPQSKFAKAVASNSGWWPTGVMP